MDHETYTDDTLRDVLTSVRSLAVVGLSPNWNRPSYFVAKYLPPQSCALNPIEQVWNLVKQEWKRTSFMILDIATKKED